MQIIDKLCNILEALSKGDPMTVSEISMAVELPIPTAHRILATMTKRGLLEKDERTKRYALGWQLVRYAKSVKGISEKKYRIDKINPIMQELALKVGESVTLAAFTGTRVIVVALTEGVHALRFYSELGKEMPFNSSAPAKLLLAFQPDKVRTRLLNDIPFERFTDKTITDLDTYLEDLERVRKFEVAYSLNELEQYCTSVSVPIKDAAGKPVLAMTVVGHADRMRGRIDEVLTQLRLAVKQAQELIRGR